ncbi:MAG: twin-arginine translocase TatA/TatE family subunit [Alphaproteobacteria bacterium]|nr:twin-arginine translocase TatA/TatE family subunit [Alphaproteobacteria bacterium]
MLSLGFWEIVVIGAVLLVVVGPERLPHVLRYLGRQYGMLRRAADDMRRAFVLEADRQDAEERYKALQERRAAAKSAREAALASAGEGAVPHDAPLPPPDLADGAASEGEATDDVPGDDHDIPEDPEPVRDPEMRVAPSAKLPPDHPALQPRDPPVDTEGPQ